MLGKFIIAGVITMAVIATSAEIAFPPKPLILYNPSPSAPIGFYKLNTDVPPTLGAQVAAYAPEWARKMADERGYLPYDYPLIKPVMAVSGDEVCYHKSGVRVPNGAVIPVLGRDHSGREMPALSGCIFLKSDEYFIASPDVQAGFDSRYFGPVKLTDILGQVEYLGKSKKKKMSKNVGFMGFEG
ncbi:S26 family signal peptidase [Hellea balneolensis]|uniref:S26 family signal peptidase n=1 Tax=Hellea balneolensis TaxID=287478 RepID=UPI0003F55B14|nr:S26 family signal peptidase [Hellea balneolensis]